MPTANISMEIVTQEVPYDAGVSMTIPLPITIAEIVMTIPVGEVCESNPAMKQAYELALRRGRFSLAKRISDTCVRLEGD